MSRRIPEILRWAASALVAGAMLAAFGAPAHAQSPETTPAPAASGISLTVAVPNGVAAEHGSTTVTALVTNQDGLFLPSGTVSFWRAGQLTDRAAIRRWDAGVGAEPPGSTTALGSATVPSLAPGESASVTASFPRSALGASRHAPTVYSLGATLSMTGAATVRAHGTVLVHQSTPAAKQPHLAVAMPITVPASTSGVIDAADLARYTAPHGVLTREISGLEGHPEVAVGIDPKIIASIRVLGGAAPRSAIAWQQQLVNLPNEIFPLQYGDADAAAEVQAGFPKLLTPTSFDWVTGPANVHSTTDAIGEPATQPPETTSPAPKPTGPVLPTSADILAWPYTLSGIVWPPEDVLSPADVTAFRKNNLTTVIASSTNVTGFDENAPQAHFRSGGADVLVSDNALSQDLREAVSAGTDTQFNAAMAAVNAQLAVLGGGQETVLATLSRASAGGSAEWARVLESLDTSPGERLVPLSDVSAQPAAPGLTLAKKSEPRGRISDVESLADTAKKVGSFASTLVEPRLLTGQERVRLLSLLGVAWLEPDADWHGAFERATARSSAILSAISIIPSGLINVASTEAPLPVTVENKLAYPVNLLLVAAPSNARLEIDSTARKTIPSDARGTVLVPVKARLGNGKVDLSLQLYSATGVPVGPSALIPVDVHAQWEGVAATVLAALIVGLFGFGIARNVRRHVRARRATEADVEVPGDGEVSGADGGAGATSSVAGAAGEAPTDHETGTRPTGGAATDG
ncbi:MAG TPA: DUF6049 family protein [Microbacteriaceae bacterium]|nr:DUF6049 family protein [Microbacteriaceae bacterium]